MVYIEDMLVNAFDYIGRLVCHQSPERTLWIGGQYLPVCARDTGVYLGFYIGYLLLPMRKKEASGLPNLWITLFMVMPMLVDAGTQFIGLRTSINELKATDWTFVWSSFSSIINIFACTGSNQQESSDSAKLSSQKC